MKQLLVDELRLKEDKINGEAAYKKAKIMLSKFDSYHILTVGVVVSSTHTPTARWQFS